MRRFRYILLLVVGVFSTTVFAQTASDLKFYQDGKTIVLTYSLDKTANVSVQVSTDGGATYSEPLQHVSGDVGKEVQPGNKRIVWDVLAEYEKLASDKVMFKLTADPIHLFFTVNGVRFKMIYVQGGTFMMGAHPKINRKNPERAGKQVTLSDYYISETEVTEELFHQVMEYKYPLKNGEKKIPTVRSWQDCQDFINALNAWTGLTFRLPTEAEWEYAARGGNKSHGYIYSGSNNIDEVAWYEKNSKEVAHLVATKMPNELGLYDMSGNVGELCSDWYDKGSYYYDTVPIVNPQGPSTGDSKLQHVTRDGYYYHGPSAHTMWSRGCSYNWTSGFRLVLVSPKPVKKEHNGHEYVDLGLPSGALWATCNVGATAPEDYGDYFAWGEIEPKSGIYSWETYKYCNGGSDSLTKYCATTIYGTSALGTKLYNTDDAARANFGGHWRMPTDSECEELITKCKWEWTTLNGINGYRVTGKYERSIFLPANGWWGKGPESIGEKGYYWASTLSIFITSADCMFFSLEKSPEAYQRSARCHGIGIRPVFSPQ